MKLSDTHIGMKVLVLNTPYSLADDSCLGTVQTILDNDRAHSDFELRITTPVGGWDYCCARDVEEYLGENL